MQRLAILAPIKGDDTIASNWEQAEYEGSTSWPPITGCDWCGEFKEEEMTHKPGLIKACQRIRKEGTT